MVGLNAWELRLDPIEDVSKATGKQLAQDLAQHFRLGRERQLTFVECELPDGGRGDLVTINPVRSKLAVHVYEVKVSRSDFWADVNAGKCLRYHEHAHRVYFATPQGLVKKDEVPSGFGLIVRGEKGWRVVKPATLNSPKPLDARWMVTLIDRAFWKDLPSLRRLADRVVVKENGEIAPRAYNYGRAVADKLYRAEKGALDPETEAHARVGRLVMALAKEAGLTKRHDSYAVEALAKLAVEQMREAATLRDIGTYLHGYGERSAGRVAELVRSTR